MNASKIILYSVFITLLFAGNTYAQEKKEDKSFDKAGDLVKRYSEVFKKTDVPTPAAYVAAFNKAKESPTIETWEAAASAANSYANVVDVLKEHYSTLFESTHTGEYIHTAANYEKVQNQYLQARNNAYLEIAKLYLANGDKASALSYALTAVSLSGVEPNTVGENLIREIVQYKDDQSSQ